MPFARGPVALIDLSGRLLPLVFEEYGGAT